MIFKRMKLKSLLSNSLIMIFILFMFYYGNKQITEKISHMKQKIHKVNERLQFLVYKEETQNAIESYSLSKEWFVDSCEWNNYLKSTTGYFLCFYYSEINCLTCVESEIKRLKKIESDIGVDNILILVDYELERDYRLFMRINNIAFKTLKINKSNIPICIENLKMPFYFIAKNSTCAEIKSALIKLVFIPEKQNSINTEYYLNTVKTIIKSPKGA